MAKSIEQRIQELEDRDEIKELTARYCWHVARGEGEAVANLFTDDGVLDVQDAEFKAVRGRESLLKFYRASVREPEVALPFIQNHIIELNGDEARGTDVGGQRRECDFYGGNGFLRARRTRLTCRL